MLDKDYNRFLKFKVSKCAFTKLRFTKMSKQISNIIKLKIFGITSTEVLQKES